MFSELLSRLLFYNVGYSSLNVSTRVDVRTWHNLTRCSYSQTCVDCHNRYKNHRSRDILLWQGQISCKCCSGFNILTLMTKVTVLPLRKHNVWSLSLTLLMNSVGVSSSLVTSVSRLLFKHQHLNASPYGFAGVYRQCRCVITVCTRKSPACHKVCNFNKIYCPFSDLTSTKTMYINPLYREVAPYMRNDA